MELSSFLLIFERNQILYLMESLSENTLNLMLQGAKHTGSFHEGVLYNFENFLTTEYNEVKKFSLWLDSIKVGGSYHNILERYKWYKNPIDYQQEIEKAQVKMKFYAEL